MSASLAATAVGDYRDAATGARVRARRRRGHLRPRARAAGCPGGPRGRRASPCTRGPTRSGSRRTSWSMRARLDASSGCRMPDWAAVRNADELAGLHRRRTAAAPVVKTPRGGYDGKGVRSVSRRHRGRGLVRHARRGRSRRCAPGRGARRLHRELAQQVARRPVGRGRGATRSSRRCSATVSAPRCSRRRRRPKRARRRGRRQHRRRRSPRASA